jgi:DNA polymerase-3 subunit epsilon
MHPFPDDRTDVIRLAKKYIAEQALFLDTETTGLSDHSEVCDIAVIDVTGAVLLDTLIKPAKQTIERQAAGIHGILPQMVQHAPTMRDLLPELERILNGRTVLVYNLEFDLGKLTRSLVNNGFQLCATPSGPDQMRPWWFTSAQEDQFALITGHTWHCAMEMYAQFYGAFNEYHGNYRWQRLSTALEQCGLEMPGEDIHRARPDAEMTRRLILYMAEQKIDEQLSMFGEESHGHE